MGERRCREVPLINEPHHLFLADHFDPQLRSAFCLEGVKPRGDQVIGLVSHKLRKMSIRLTFD